MSPAAHPIDPQRGYLLVRRDGVLWGIANGAVENLARHGTRFRLAVGGAELGVDEVVGVVPELAVWPVAGDGGFILGEALVEGAVVRVVNLEALGGPQ